MKSESPGHFALPVPKICPIERTGLAQLFGTTVAEKLILIPIRLRLVCFVVLCAIPLLVMSVIQSVERLARMEQDAKSNAEGSAIRLHSQLTQTLVAAENMAHLVAALDLDSEDDRLRCSAVLARATHSSVGGLVNNLVVNPKGDVICSARSLSAPVNGADRPHFQEALLTGRTTLSGYVVGRIIGRGALQLVSPQIDSAGGITYLGVAVMSAKNLIVGDAGRAGMPITISVFDRAGVLVSRYPESVDVAAGTDFSRSQLFQRARSGDAEADSVGLDGRKRHYAFRKVDFHGQPALWIASGVDVTALEAAAWSEGMRDLLVFLLVLSCVVTLTGFASVPFILTRYRGMQQVAGGVIAGNMGQRIELKWRDELTPVERALNQMLDVIEHDRGLLAESESRYRMLFEHNLDGVLLTAPNGDVLAANPSACALLQRPEGEILTLGSSAIVDMADSRLAFLLQERNRTGVARGELRFVRADGSLLEAEVTSSAFLDHRGTEMTCLVLRDLSELRRARMQLMLLNQGLEKTVERRTADLASAVKDLEAFAYSVAHDLRAPLITMNGFATVLFEDFGELLPDKGRYYLGRITSGADKLGRLIDDLLAYSRMGRQEMRKCACDAEQLVQAVLEDTAAAYPDWRGEVRVGPLPHCHGDVPLLRQVWVNLIGNAFKYSAKKAHPLIEISFEQQDGEGVYIVKDNGDGFDMAYAGRIFEVFQRLHTDREFVGTGVGLAIVRRIVERHGGRVWAVGVPSAGATFSFTLNHLGFSGGRLG